MMCLTPTLVRCLFSAMGVMIYALGIYHWRANAIRKRGAGPYDDRLGPTVICTAMLGEFQLQFKALTFPLTQAWHECSRRHYELDTPIYLVLSQL